MEARGTNPTRHLSVVHIVQFFSFAPPRLSIYIQLYLLALILAAFAKIPIKNILSGIFIKIESTGTLGGKSFFLKHVYKFIAAAMGGVTAIFLVFFSS